MLKVIGKGVGVGSGGSETPESLNLLPWVVLDTIVGSGDGWGMGRDAKSTCTSKLLTTSSITSSVSPMLETPVVLIFKRSSCHQF